MLDVLRESERSTSISMQGNILSRSDLVRGR
jgi:hypothetical protein